MRYFFYPFEENSKPLFGGVSLSWLITSPISKHSQVVLKKADPSLKFLSA